MAPGWSNGAQKSSAYSQRADESIARVRWPKLEGRIFRVKGNWGPEGRNGTWLVQWGPKKFCRLAGSWQVDRARQMAKTRRSDFSCKRKLGPGGPKWHLVGPMGPKKVLQIRSELASRSRASDGQNSKIGFFV